MNSDEFKDDNIDTMVKINYVNEQLKANNSLTQIAKNIGVSRSTLGRKFEKVKYIFDEEVKQYVCDETITPVTQVTQNKSVTNNTNVAKVKDVTSVTDVTIVENNTGVTSVPNQIYDEMLEMLEWYKEQKEIKTAEIIALPTSEELTGDIITRSFKMYANVLKKYDDFCYNNPKIKKQDIINMALLEYINNHK